MSVEQSPLGRSGLCLPGGRVEPVVSADLLLNALRTEGVEQFRPLLPVGYAAGVEAYRQAVASLEVRDLSDHYTEGLRWFHDEFVPRLKTRLTELSGGVWTFDDHEAVAAGSDVDFITHLVEAVASRRPICLFPGDWYGFCAGVTHPENIRWTDNSRGHLACLCVPSVRNGHVTAEMLDFLAGAETCLLNLNLYPSLAPDERRTVAEALAPFLARSVLSISFSRGFGLTASQLGVALVPRAHPLRREFAKAWDWHTYFFNAIAARAFLAIDGAAMETVDAERRRWVADWLCNHDLPAITTGSYYVKSFRVTGTVPEVLRPLVREDVVRLCFKPPLG